MPLGLFENESFVGYIEKTDIESLISSAISYDIVSYETIEIMCGKNFFHTKRTLFLCGNAENYYTIKPVGKTKKKGNKLKYLLFWSIILNFILGFALLAQIS